jgi:hypothetical protein
MTSASSRLGLLVAAAMAASSFTSVLASSVAATAGCAAGFQDAGGGFTATQLKSKTGAPDGITSGQCWGATFSAAGVKKNDTKQFVAQSD